MTRVRALLERHLILIGYLALAVAVAVTYLKVYRLAEQGAQAHQAQCALRTERVQSLRESKRFLKDHPNGVPGLATAAQIRQSIANAERTLAALSVLRC